MTPASPQPETEEHFEVAQEEDRVASRKIFAIFVGAVVITVAAVWVQSEMLDAKRSDIGVKQPAAAPVGDRQIDGVHQTSIERDRHGLDLREEQKAALAKWSWIDRDHALAKIPVDAAMDLLVAHPELMGARGASSATAPASASASTTVSPQSGATP